MEESTCYCESQIREDLTKLDGGESGEHFPEWGKRKAGIKAFWAEGASLRLYKLV